MKAIGWQLFVLLVLWLIASPVIGAYVHDSGILEYGWIYGDEAKAWINIPFIFSWLGLMFATLVAIFGLYDWLTAKK